MRVATAVPALVMRFDNGPHFPREVGFGKELRAGGRVSLDEGPLVRGESALLVQDVGGNGDLAKVMEIGRDAIPEQRDRLGAHAARDLAREVSHAFDVA